MRFDRLFMVAVTGVTAGALLYFSGRARTGMGARSEALVAQSDGSSGSGAGGPHPGAAGTANAAAGERRYLQTCAACHGPGGLGQPHVGANLRDSRFIREQTDDTLVAFVKRGRSPNDPRSVLGLTMPPLGGNPSLDDAQIRDIVAFLRTVQAQAQDAQAEVN